MRVTAPVWTDLLDETARILNCQRPVVLLRGLEETMPMAFGTRHPAILLPAVADTWSESQRRAVLLHELAHVARYDCLTQSLAAIACASIGFIRASWWVARRLRIERELACDDRVLGAGADPDDYARHC
jgi:beta-lactamase regulating signal transducer with metallopeptidase domain